MGYFWVANKFLDNCEETSWCSKALTPEGANCPKSSFSRPWRVTTPWHFEGCCESIPCSLDRPSTALNVNCGAVIPVFVCLFFCPYFTAQKPTRGFYSRAGEVLQLQPSCKTQSWVFSFLLPGHEFWSCQLNPPQRRRKKEREKWLLGESQKNYGVVQPQKDFRQFYIAQLRSHLFCLSRCLSNVLGRENFLCWLMDLSNLMWIWLDETEKRVLSCIEGQNLYYIIYLFYYVIIY